MRIHISNLNQVIYDFVVSEVFTKYATIWRNNGESNLVIDGKLFSLSIGAKMILNNDLSTKFPLVSMLLDKEGYLDLDKFKQSALDIYNEYASKGKKVIIPYIDWDLDAEDITKIYEIAKQYSI